MADLEGHIAMLARHKVSLQQQSYKITHQKAKQSLKSVTCLISNVYVKSQTVLLATLFSKRSWARASS